MDLPLALQFLDASSSRMIGLARSWMETREEPIDLLFVLSREVGQALGPWETFRLCALLGLTPAHAVHELGLDVLSEPVAASPRQLPPVAEAFAIAHARATWPNEPGPYTSTVFERLHEAEGESADSYAIAAGAVVSALANGPSSAEEVENTPFRVPELPWRPEAQEVKQAFPLLQARLEQGPLEKGVPELAELVRLCPPVLSGDLRHRFDRAITHAQQEDGGFGGARASRRFRELTTLRMVLALHPLRDVPHPDPTSD